MCDYAGIDVMDRVRVRPFLELMASNDLTRTFNLKAYEQMMLFQFLNSTYIDDVRKICKYYKLTDEGKSKIDYIMHDYKELDTFMKIDWM